MWEDQGQLGRWSSPTNMGRWNNKTGATSCLPSSNQTWQLNLLDTVNGVLMGTSYINGGLSIATFDYQRLQLEKKKQWQCTILRKRCSSILIFGWWYSRWWGSPTMGFIVAGEEKGCVLLQQPFLLVIPMTILCDDPRSKGISSGRINYYIMII